MRRWLWMVGALALSCGGEAPRGWGGGEASALCQESRDAAGRVSVTCGAAMAEAQPGRDGEIVAPSTATSLRTESLADGGACAVGGTRVSWGTDVDFSGALEDAEVEGGQDICHGEGGAAVSSLLLKDEPIEPGEVCAIGGLRVRLGYDEDADQALADSEVQAQLELCTPPCPRGSYLDVTLGACRPGQIVVLEGVITEEDLNYPAARLGEPFRLAIVYDLEEQELEPLGTRFDSNFSSRATYQFATFRVPLGELTWEPPQIRWGRRGDGTGLYLGMNTGSGLVTPDFNIGSLEVELALATDTWAGTKLPPSSVVGTATGGTLNFNFMGVESNGVTASVTAIIAPQVFDLANLSPQEMP